MRTGTFYGISYCGDGMSETTGSMAGGMYHESWGKGIYAFMETSTIQLGDDDGSVPVTHYHYMY